MGNDNTAKDVVVEGVVSDFFEGAEKLLELWFEPSETGQSLRLIKREDIDEFLRVAGCCVVAQCSNEKWDSYVLSESSLFISDDMFLLKTCGTTTLLAAIPNMISLAKDLGRNNVDDVFYSRNQFMEPEQQPAPHVSFEEEVKFLDSLFDGAAYQLGRLNGDSWYLYMLDHPDGSIEKPDQTMEILMMDLDQEAMKAFHVSPEYPTTEVVTKKSGIADFLPGAMTSGALFNPCGYSVNGLLGDAYFTIHVTPQEGFSYASFETNYLAEDYTELIQKVLKTFCPGKFVMTVFANPQATCTHSAKAYDAEELTGYNRTERQEYQFNKYNLSYGHFSRDLATSTEDVSRASATADHCR
ncbi:adenosylmethionine decarboxylase [Sphaeroforma arctica JP610]|uniref:S-adenosylmethionine decarboxylase proenzyme n=1 Tax=Sphaeroforma arctica JP610 TaxID=667725 RepID=A0A0L0FPH6_9EUKA|nr:adenosylmethionine decarboxylase [Sphaeroforma arctica JP610]KNC78715.1 adenosylmethionine decarboxylase [Sphaeroforma arctica JP610]|eukprot:XP_014152617.1 adenosylmethionine decarboxylase [Sphaeroforma arctica JP610]